jgi:hypothetical protein
VTASHVRAAAQGDQVAMQQDAEPGGPDAHLLDADATGRVHPLLVRQEFVVEPDETMQSGEPEDTADGPGVAHDPPGRRLWPTGHGRGNARSCSNWCDDDRHLAP